MPDYILKRSDRRTLSLEITREGTLLVRAPQRLSQNEIDRFVSAHEKWIEEKLSAQRRRLEARPPLTKEEEAFYRKWAKEYLPPRLEYFAKLMGLTPSGVKITSAKTRFGSCSSENSISLSWHLMRYNPVAIDYVLVHELAHIVHKNHSPAFYALVATVFPDYKERRALLRE